MGLFKKFETIDQIYINAVATLGRFPFTIISAIIAAIVSILEIKVEERVEKEFWQSI